MITAELNSGSYVPVDLIRWTREGRVQVRHCRVIDNHRVFGVYAPVTAFKLIHSGGRAALAKALAGLPRVEATP